MSSNRTVDTSIFHEGTQAIRTTATASGQPGVKCMMSGVIASGESVSWSMWVYSSVAVTLRPYWERTSPSYTGGSDPNTVNVLANTWTKISSTYTFNATQADPAGVYGFGVLATTAFAIGDYLVSDEMLIEKSNIVGTWFNGATAAAGDFTYAWSGVANASSSLQKAFYVAATSNLNTTSIQSTDWSANGSKSIRVIPSLTATTDTAVSLKAGYTLENKTYTLLATCRVKAPQTGTLDTTRARRIMLYYTGVGPSSSAQAPNAVGVYPLSVTFTVTDATQYQDMRLYNGASNGGGDIWWDNIMLVEGVYTGDYLDGTKPFSKWTGTVQNSLSVGHPPQLSDFAGIPSLNLVGVNSGGVTIPVSAYSARTIYLVYDVAGTTLNYPNYGSYGINGSNGITFQAGPIGNTSLFPRLDFPGGSSNFGISLPNGRLGQRRNVVAFAFNQGLTSLAASLNGGTDVVVNTFAAGNGWTDGRTNPVSSHADGSGITMLVYYAEHDQPTRLAISRYLGNKYGANVA
jgi:hypothetical protein